MWYLASVVAPPEGTAPLALDQAKRQCGIALDNDDLDDELERLMVAARDYVERYCSIRVPTQTVAVKCDTFGDFARVPVAPVQSVTSIGYIDTAGIEKTLDASAYELRNDGLTASVVPAYGQRWPAIQPGSRIIVAAVVGFAVVPPTIISAMLLFVRAQHALAGSDVNLKKKVVEGVGSREWDMTGAVDGMTRQAIANFLEPFRCWP
ncbi:head-tail connector protein [Chelatococcus asaccharovorans]|uniref:head-tail connector protein n=1 Tax=Chelatococcus asaccharovorans TaxID=28210 RepID=UPI00224C66CA|nr:phage head-tail connector protein [Chelatococcus asaccharovorans]CAH1672035.1 hypothetical protein CHELA17_61323 [Chelatococcus asaccharovorans]CAH1676551.1 hypothetical protein CHELA40_14297 [Chelatococcus asaccharovorans]